MDILLSIFYSLILIIVIFGLPISHLVKLIKGKDIVSQVYENSEDYIELATMQVFNAVFLLCVFFVFCWMLKDEGSGTFNGLMLAPFLIIYIVSVVAVEKKIDKLPRLKRKNYNG